MTRTRRIVHLLSLLAFVIGVVAPVANIPVAADATSEAAVEFTPGGDEPAESATATEMLIVPNAPREVVTAPETASIRSAETPADIAEETASPVETAIPAPNESGSGEAINAEKTDSTPTEDVQARIISPKSQPSAKRNARASNLSASNVPGWSFTKVDNMADAASVSPGDLITYTVSVIHSGETDGQSYSFVDSLRSDVIYISHTAAYPDFGDYCGYEQATHAVSCTSVQSLWFWTDV